MAPFASSQSALATGLMNASAQVTLAERLSEFGTHSAMLWRGSGAVPARNKGKRTVTSSSNHRRIGASLAGALVTAMLFVSAAVGPIPIA